MRISSTGGGGSNKRNRTYVLRRVRDFHGERCQCRKLRRRGVWLDVFT